MMQRFRWQIWVPRLLMLAVSLLGLQFVAGLVVRSQAIKSAEASLGLQAEIAHSRVEFRKRQVVLNNLRFRPYGDDAEQVLAADQCVLTLTAKPLLYRQAVVQSGYVRGLQFTIPTASSMRANAGTETSASAKAAMLFRDDSELVASEWIGRIAQRLQQEGTAHLESIRRTEAFFTNWTNQSAAIESEGEELERIAKGLEGAVDAAETNPLRNAKFVANLPEKIADLQKAFADLLDRLAKMPDQLDVERRTIINARRVDEQALVTPTKLEPVEANAISGYLVRQEAARRLTELFALLSHVRSTIPALAVPHQSASRGEEVLFAGCRQTPSLLIRSLELQGSARVAGQPVEMRGLLSDFSNAPWLHNEPIRLRVRTAGVTPLELVATIDRTHGAARDTLMVDCQGLLTPEMTLGRPDQLALLVAPSQATLSISVTADRDALSGHIQLVQRDVHIKPAVGGELAKASLAEPLNETLNHLDSVATRITIAGTLGEPKCTLSSNLGPAVAEAMDRAIQKASLQQARTVIADVDHQIDERLATIERQIAEQQARWKTRAASVQSDLKTVAASRIATKREPAQASRTGQPAPTAPVVR